MSLWSPFTPRTRMRRFALLDAKGNCRALREARERPDEAGWVEVRELRQHWLGQPLPAQAMLAPPQPLLSLKPLLAA
ncbi:hypothetical protein AAFN46_03425 [Pseudomonas sp. CAU 1711]|uniref:hypothetical protein n=1 Tax=Pseudomonas sp. CAU 1711 TaxID=3140356 RepID=UPI003260A712